MPRKKGQFFIISAVVILLVLFALVSSIRTDWKSDISDEQANDAKILLKNIQSGINATIRANNSSTDRLRDGLESFAAAERSSAKDRYSIDINYNVSETNVMANVTIKSEDIYAEKTISLPR